MTFQSQRFAGGSLESSGEGIECVGHNREIQRSPRVALINNSADFFGASRALANLCGQLIDNGFSILVILPENGHLSDLVAKLGARVAIDRSLTIITRADARPLRAFRLLARYFVSVWRLRKLFIKERIDLVHTNTGVILSPAAAAWLARRPHVWHVRETFREFGMLWPILRTYIMRFSERVFVISRSVAEQFPATRSIMVINDGSDGFVADQGLRECAAELRRSLKIPRDLPVIGCVGRIKFERKGQEILVEASALLRAKGIDHRVVIVGSPAAGNEDHLERLRALILQRELEDTVLLLSERPDPAPAFALMDVIVIPSVVPEPFGLVMLEAMSLGIPVVATAHGGPIDVIEDGENGLLVAPGNPAALATALERLLRDQAERERLGRAGRERWQKDFTASAPAEKVQRVYCELLKLEAPIAAVQRN